MYLFILACIVVYLLYFISHLKNLKKVTNVREGIADVNMLTDVNCLGYVKQLLSVKEELFNSKLNEQKCQAQLQAQSQVQLPTSLQEKNIQDVLLEKIYNPLASPESIYPSGGINRRGYDAYQQYQMIGYIDGGSGQYPIFGRQKYPGRTDKMEYYTMNESRGRIKIPFKTKNYNELYDGDAVIIPELGGDFIFKKYEIENVRYNPNML
jgi:hypothetical protein